MQASALYTLLGTMATIDWQRSVAVMMLNVDFIFQFKWPSCSLCGSIRLAVAACSENVLLTRLSAMHVFTSGHCGYLAATASTLQRPVGRVAAAVVSFSGTVYFFYVVKLEPRILTRMWFVTIAMVAFLSLTPYRSYNIYTVIVAPVWSFIPSFPGSPSPFYTEVNLHA